MQLLSVSVSLAVLQLVLRSKFVSFDIEKKLVAANETALSRRSEPEEPLSNQVLQYWATIELGTPGQEQLVAIDTGSSDLWVFSSEAEATYTYDKSSSSTYEYVNSDFSILYADLTSYSGDFVKDKIKWGDVEVTTQFATSSQNPGRHPASIFGIGPVSREATSNHYPNFPVVLKTSGVIDSTAYSIYLNKKDSASGTLLFGGVDKSKYTGTLYEFTFADSTDLSVEFEVNGHRIAGSLDTGTSFTYLPSDVTAGIAAQFGATYDFFAQAYTLDSVPEDASLTYNIQGAEITVESSDLFTQLNGRTVLTILPTTQSSNLILLGDSFLRSAYVVYDLDNGKGAIAQADWSAGESQIEAITNGIPFAEPVPGF